MRIPHEEPKQAIVCDWPGNYPKEDGLTWADFHPECTATNALPQNNKASEPQWKHVAATIQDLRTCFAQHTPRSNYPRCCTLDRSAVLAVYQEALARIEHISDIDARKIHLEVVSKVSTILGLRTAEPTDPVFTTAGAFLSPLEPHYAHPRLDFYNRTTHNEDDGFYYTGFRRLREWRKEGWPKVYPSKAVEREKRERREKKERRREGRGLLRETAAEGLIMAYRADSVEWGDEVDAEPERPWK